MAGVGVLHAPETTHQAAVAFEVHLTKNATERMPEPITATYQGITIQKLTLRACDNTNAAKILFLTQVFQQTGAIQTVSIAKPPAKD
jgi:NaMN:DMB phosphoribosyltransferase